VLVALNIIFDCSNNTFFGWWPWKKVS